MHLPEGRGEGLWLAGAKADLRLRQAPGGRADSIRFQVERVLLLFGARGGVGEAARRLGASSGQRVSPR